MEEIRNRFAALDFGTNSLRLLVADWKEKGRLDPVYQDMRMTRLGRTTGINKKIISQAIADNILVAKEFCQVAQDLGAKNIVAVATSAVRDADNREEFILAVQREVGLQLHVIDGENEARLTYLGLGDLVTRFDRPLVVDIGGGSTELIWRGEEEGIRYTSLDMGAVRMTEAYLKSEPIDPVQYREMIGKINNMIREEVPDLQQIRGPQVILGVGGTITALAAIEQGLVEYCRDKVHGFSISYQKIEGWLSQLASISLKERKGIPGLQPGRADIIVAGVAILVEIMKLAKVNKVIVSEADILTGIILQFAADADR